jgi:hypothetical protein
MKTTIAAGIATRAQLGRVTGRCGRSIPRDRAVNANVDIATTDTNTGETDSALLLNLRMDGTIPLSDRKRQRLREFPPRWPRSSQSMPPPIQVLHSVDESFRKIPHVTKDIQQFRS